MNVDKFFEKLVVAYDKYSTKIKNMRQAVTHNEVVVDRNGMLHAAKSGYVTLDGEIYVGGQFVPFDIAWSGNVWKRSVTIEKDCEEYFVTFLKSFILYDDVFSGQEKERCLFDYSFGKEYENNGKIYKKCYLTANQSVIDKLAPLAYKELMSVKEADEKGFQKGKSWLVEKNKIMKSFNYKVNVLHLNEYSLDLQPTLLQMDYIGEEVCYATETIHL